MSPLFQRVAVVGLGLLGGSVALAARQRGIAGRVVGAGRRRGPLEAALARGVVDEIGSASEACRGADLVILGTPVGSMPAVLREVSTELSPGALVTDVGSVKGVLSDLLPGLLPVGVRYVGSHPMAGSHRRGNEHARGDLLENACCVVMAPSDPEDAAEAEATDRVCGFWEALGARVVRRTAEEHDAQVAWVSHLPHVLAFAFAEALATAPPEGSELVGSGFRDFTRIARSDSELWAEILLANRKALAGPLAEITQSLARMARAIEEADGDGLEQLLATAAQSLATEAPLGLDGGKEKKTRPGTAPDREQQSKSTQ